MQNWQDTVISQYANSPRLLALIEAFNDAVDPGPDIDAFFQYVWNIDTAVGEGLDTWGRIVGVSRNLFVPTTGTAVPFGFSEENGNVTGFLAGPFYGGVNTSPNFALADSVYQRLILVKAFLNISDRSIPSINKQLLLMFPGRGNAYIVDSGGMAAQLSFNFGLTPIDLAILQQSGAFVGPTGVLITISAVALPYIFTFNESGTAGDSFGSGAFFT